LRATGEFLQVATTRRLIVRTICYALVAVIFSVFFVAGCDDTPEPTKVDTTVKPPPTEFKGMLDDQMKNTKNKVKQ
jgi:hypothetical protein